ncbi:MAG: TonB-dependent receptor, partial [Bacteroidetes bacterium]|nr:TonB-dependent receptor [Bacteroidota bacterium]
MRPVRRFCLTSLILLIAFTLDVRAQASTGPTADPTPASDVRTVAGIVHEDAGQPLVSATVAIRAAADSSLVTGTVTDASGRFEIPRLVPGSYFAEASFVGFRTFRSDNFDITPSTTRIELGIIRLRLDAAVLDGIQVTAERAEVAFEIDRTVYNTRDQITSAGGSATDVLQNIPSVEVDVDGNVSLRGNQNINILINGKPSPLRGDFLAAFLQQIPASSVDRVEVIPNPSARYDPDGQAGAINILLRKDTEIGKSGSVTASGASSGDMNLGGSLTMQRGRLTFFSNYGFSLDDRDSQGFNFRENRYLDPRTYFEQDNEGTRSSTSHLLNSSLDIKTGEISEVSLSGLFSTRQGDDASSNFYNELDVNRHSVDRSIRRSLQTSDGRSLDLSLSGRRIVEASRREVTGELRYNVSNGANLDDLTERLMELDGASADLLLEQTVNELDNHDAQWNGQMDWIHSLGDWKLEAGAKATLRQMDNRFDVETLDMAAGLLMTDASLTNRFVFDEDVVAGYGIVSRKLGKFEAQAGLRVEQARTTFQLRTTSESFDNDYASLFPSAFLNYNLSAQKQVKVSYSKRVSRPRTSQLNPFTTFTDPLNLNVGNPNLQPEYIHAVEMAYQQFGRKGSLSIAPYYRRTVDKIERYKTIDPQTGISTLTFRNFDTSSSYGAEIIGSLRVGTKLSGFSSFNAYRIVTEATNVDASLANDAVSWSSRASVSYKVAEGTDLQGFYFYRAPIDVAQGRISSFSVANLSIRQRILGDRGSLTLRVSDPLNRMGFRFEVDQAAFYQLGTRNWE